MVIADQSLHKASALDPASGIALVINCLNTRLPGGQRYHRNFDAAIGLSAFCSTIIGNRA